MTAAEPSPLVGSDLPEGWAFDVLESVGKWSTGGTPSRKISTYFGSGYPWIKSGDLNDGVVLRAEEAISQSGLANSAAKLLPPATVTIALYGATIGKLAILGIEAATNQACASCRVDPSISTNSFVFYYLLQQRPALIAAGQGGAQPNLTNQIVRRWPIPLPPLAEQQRIVIKVEQLLAKVNATRQRLARVPGLLKRFRQAVLAAACSGRLTDDWRKQNVGAIPTAKDLLQRIIQQKLRVDKATVPPTHAATPNPNFEADIPEGWSIASMDELTIHITSGSRDWKRYYRDDGPGTFIMAQNVRPLFFDRSYRLGVAPPLKDRDRERSEVRRDDILVTIVGANTGDVCRMSERVEQHYVCQSVALIRPVIADLSAFLELFLNSPLHGQAQYKNWIYGEGRPHLSFDHLRETAVLLPPLEEQREIVRRVESLFTLAGAIEKRVTAATARAEKLTQAILAKAFRGELVPTEAELARREGRSYESASVLLARIRNSAEPTRIEQRAPKVLSARKGNSINGGHTRQRTGRETDGSRGGN